MHLAGLKSLVKEHIRDLRISHVSKVHGLLVVSQSEVLTNSR